MSLSRIQKMDETGSQWVKSFSLLFRVCSFPCRSGLLEWTDGVTVEITQVMLYHPMEIYFLCIKISGKAFTG